MNAAKRSENHTANDEMAPPTQTTGPSPIIDTTLPVTKKPEQPDIDTRNLAILNMVGYNTTLTGDALAVLAARITEHKQPLPLSELDNVTWSPFDFLFYGTLQNPRVINFVADLGGPQDLRPARVEGYRSKMWTPTIPMAIPFEGAEVRGRAWRVPSPQAVFKLIRYETSAYQMAKCRILLDDGEVVEEGRIFVSAVRDDEKLEDGEFDLLGFLRRVS